MRIERVSLIAFGPFSNLTIDFTPGMTIVHGPNETGKSTIHAATYGALCGVRRGRGATRVEDRIFRDLHRPWDGNAWRVAATIELADGRRIELRQDLDGRVDCRATDLALGRDVSSEIVFEGSPDASRWLGLDRRSFLATASVRQCEVLAVLQSAEDLQEHLQRAAATAGADETAARALQLVDEFRADQVGLDRANSARPLRRARLRVEEAAGALETARAAHARYLDQQTEADKLAALARQKAVTLAALEARVAARQADEVEAQLRAAQDIVARWASSPPPDALADEELADEVSSALGAWQQLQAPPEMSGESAEDLRARLEVMPATPVGDTAPHTSVVNASTAYQAAARALSEHLRTRPQDPQTSLPSGTPTELLHLASELELVEPVVDPALASRRQALQVEAASPPRGHRRVVGFITAGLLAALAIAFAAIGVPVAALGAGVLAAAAIVYGLVHGADARRVAVLEELRQVEGSLGAAAAAADDIRTRREKARLRTSDLRLPADPKALRDAAATLVRAQAHRTAVDQWETTRGRLSELESERAHELRVALMVRGMSVDGDLEAAVSAYVDACQERHAVAELAAGRAELEQRLRSRQELEVAAQRANDQRATLRQRLLEAAGRCCIDASDEQAMATRLEAWLQARQARAQEHQAHVSDWATLRSVLGERTLDEFRQEVTAQRARATMLAREIAPDRVAAASLEPDVDAQLVRLRDEAHTAANAAEHARGVAETTARTVPSVPAAEEELSAAEEELDRVNNLARVLDLTRRYLEEAQEHVHRDIAPQLADSVRAWLPRITGARYTDVAVDPETLTVTVCGDARAWRQAHLLSQGTREQIYLLLRLAMTDRLTTKGELCPLLLDEVTVQADTQRTAALLTLLHEMSKDRQVILFSQEPEVLAWARTHLVEPSDRLQLLESAVTSV